MPKVSVIMPAYNAEKYIREAIDSILVQTFRDFEFIIINDCSTDRTEEIILSYDDPRIIYLKNENNLGVAETLNSGIEIARGEYIARMDADDISLPERFQKQVAYLDDHPMHGICGSSIIIFGEDVSPYIVYYATKNTAILADQVFNSAFAHPCVMMRSSILRTVGGYDCAFEKAEDYELWYRILKHCKGYNFAQPLLFYRHHDSQVTNCHKSTQRDSVLRLHKKMLYDMGVSFSEQEIEVILKLCFGERTYTQSYYESFVSGGKKIITASKGFSFALRKVYANLNIAVLLSSNIERPIFFTIKEPLYLLCKSKWRII